MAGIYGLCVVKCVVRGPNGPQSKMTTWRSDFQNQQWCSVIRGRLTLFMLFHMTNEKKWIGLQSTFVHIRLNWARWTSRGWRDDSGFEIRAPAVWGRAHYLSVTETPLNIEFVFIKPVALGGDGTVANLTQKVFPLKKHPILWWKKEYSIETVCQFYQSNRNNEMIIKTKIWSLHIE